MTSSRQQTNTDQRIDERIDRAILWITLGALFLIPLTFSWFDVLAVFSELRLMVLHLSAGAIAVLWSWQAAIYWYNHRQAEDQPAWDLVAWSRGNAARYALVAAFAWVAVQIFSTLLSQLPVISFYGGDEARSGYNLYDLLSMWVIFFSVAVRFRSLATLEKFVWVLVGSGSIAALYGILQHFGWDPIGGNQDQLRVISSFGNTLNFGAYMVMAVPATLALSYKYTTLPRTRNRDLTLLAFTIALTLQTSGLWFAGGRGPFVGAGASLVSFAIIGAVLFSPRQMIRPAISLVVAAVLTAIIVALPSPTGDVGLERALSIGDQIRPTVSSSTNIVGGLQGRFNIWESTLDQATSWHTPLEEPAVNKALRPLFGLGPDMFVYSWGFVGKPQSDLAMVDHAHNFLLQIMIEQGFLGLVAFILLGVLVAIAILTVVLKLRGKSDPLVFIALALFPAVIGKSVELQTGVSRVSDLTMTLAVFAAVIGVYEILKSRSVDSSEQSPSGSSESKRTISVSAPNSAALILSFVSAVAITVLASAAFFGWDIRRAEASRILAVDHDNPDIFVKAGAWADAQAKAPERESFTYNLAEQYLNEAQNFWADGNAEEALRLIHIGRDMALDYEKRDPFEIDIQITLSKMASRLLQWESAAYAQEVVDRHLFLADTYPGYPTLAGTAATAFASLSLNELAIEYADRAISTEATTKNWAKAWYAKGAALYQLDQDEDAFEVLNTAIEKDDDGEITPLVHQILAAYWRERGDDTQADHHAELGGGEYGAHDES
jgi:tetratricopeptide (TPR) repeat protein